MPFVPCLSPSSFLGGSWRCGSHSVTMRQQARGWKLDNQKEGRTESQKDPQIWLRCKAPYPALGSLDKRKRDLCLIKPLWLEFSVTHSWNYSLFIYQVSTDVTMNKKKNHNCTFSTVQFKKIFTEKSWGKLGPYLGVISKNLTVTATSPMWTGDAVFSKGCFYSK